MAAQGEVADRAYAFYNSLGTTVFPMYGITAGMCRCRAAQTCGTPGKHPKNKHWRTLPSEMPGVLDNWGVATGPSLVVIDVDRPELVDDTVQELFEQHPTFTVTTSKGYHKWYSSDVNRPLRSVVKPVPGIDVRAVGGLVVAPPSRHISGVRYKANNTVPAQLPDYFYTVLPPFKAVAHREYVTADYSTGRSEGDLAVRTLSVLCLMVENCAPGGRNQNLYRTARTFWEYVGAGILSALDVEDLVASAVASGLEYGESVKTIESAK